MVDPVTTTGAAAAPSPTSPQSAQPGTGSFAAMLGKNGPTPDTTAAANAQPPAGGCGCCGGRPATASSHLKPRPATTPATAQAAVSASTVSTVADRALLAYLRNLVTNDTADQHPAI